MFQAMTRCIALKLVHGARSASRYGNLLLAAEVCKYIVVNARLF